MPCMRRALTPAALATALALSACGGGGNGTSSTTAQTATGPHVSPGAFESCLNEHGIQTGPPGSDALLAAYGQQTTSQGGTTFIIVTPLSQAFVFPMGVDLAKAKSALATAEQEGGLRADNLHAQTAGNVLLVYFVGTTPQST